MTDMNADPVRICNRSARMYVRSRTPFQGNNLYGRFIDACTFVVYSYGPHWPMFAHRGGCWYANVDRASVTTSKHWSQAHPHADTIDLTLHGMRRMLSES